MDAWKYEIYFECSPGYLTCEQSERVMDFISGGKINKTLFFINDFIDSVLL